MSITRGFGQAILRTASEDQVHRPVEVYTIAGRNLDRGSTGTGAYYPADDLLSVDEVRNAPFLSTGFLLLAHEPALRAPDRGHVQEEPDMRCEPQAPRMSQPMPVDNYRLHVRFDLLERP